MQLNRHKQPSQDGDTHSKNVEQFIDELIDVYRPRLTKLGIILETDFDQFDASFDSTMLHASASALIENAIESMPHGGEISITLIDGEYQWELEVADSLGMIFNTLERKTEGLDESNHELPVIIPFPDTEKLRSANRAAIAQGGQIQTWTCPQGGTAHVLVIPRFRNQAVSSRQTSQPGGQITKRA